MKLFIVAIAIATAMTAPLEAQTSIAILTGSTSGIYYPLGNALSSIFIKAIPGVRVNVQVTQCSIENLRLLEDGDGELAFILGGFQWVAALQKHDAWRRIPVIVITALDSSAEDRARLNSGIETVLLKDAFNPAELIGRIRQLVARSRQSDKLVEAAS
jgi:DNA-binding NarL/FixJ family response regulator